ncbi:class I SAM-dependent methyltransferase [Sphingomonas panacisoli]|uniref:Class I SAM-dependent methyltransferase n=1 Tax=Sphingomonas panacisoli TaxID=1813879 RepID=A0A5B8LE73_9SPHN|nr:class I SAM-dependent methyltransferase [Sphingomonas panacisoli]QDZ06209.1 class I SAM-dependent methyltransferase [Sphingomonas panacisoli]
MANTVTRYARRMGAVYRTYGAGGLAARIIDKVRSAFGVSSKAHRSFIDAKAKSDAAFDEAAEADTGGVQHLPGLTIASANRVHGSSHIAINPAEFTTSLAVAEQDFVAVDQTTFVDLGSGKGRALLMAADRGYRHLIGVEFAAELDAIARRNIAQRTDRERFTLIHGDATEFDLPDGPVLLFLYHPFDRPIMAEVARRVGASWRADSRQLRVVYQHPIFADVWLQAGWRSIATPPDCTIFDPGSLPKG